MAILESLGLTAGAAAFERIRAAVRPNPYAPRIPDQAAIAAGQATGALRGGTAGLAGSEADYYVDPQGVSTVGYLRIVQDLPSARRPASTFRAGDPGADPDDPTVLADFRSGPVRLPVEPWGVSQRGLPHVISARLNEPTAKTPLPRAVVRDRAAAAPTGPTDALELLWGG